jgi:hypothetical protein
MVGAIFGGSASAMRNGAGKGPTPGCGDGRTSRELPQMQVLPPKVQGLPALKASRQTERRPLFHRGRIADLLLRSEKKRPWQANRPQGGK